VFGSESSGLTTDELARCAGVVVIPTDPAYRDLNVAQSVVLMAYLTFRALRSPRAPYAAESASQSSREGLAEVLDTVAREAGFLKAGSGPVALELRQMVHRLGLTRRDTEILRALLRRALHRMEKAGGE
jgi:tRNA C32,U32 (ribose-2'-O)-methylase TrmJ